MHCKRTQLEIQPIRTIPNTGMFWRSEDGLKLVPSSEDAYVTTFIFETYSAGGRTCSGRVCSMFLRVESSCTAYSAYAQQSATSYFLGDTGKRATKRLTATLQSSTHTLLTMSSCWVVVATLRRTTSFPSTFGVSDVAFVIREHSSMCRSNTSGARRTFMLAN